ncbi:MAG: radical SAM protein [Deltaproteobacteria bacterium]|nr:radical SAM protein [Deltaproteobacteria bacterium]
MKDRSLAINRNPIMGEVTPIMGYVPDILWKRFSLTKEELANSRILESSVYLTRKCNLKCQYCKIIKTDLPEELTTEKWLEVFDILALLGTRFINIAGGEPTIVPGLIKMIKHLNKYKHIEYSIVSNSVFNEKRLDDMVQAGLRSYVASIDVIGSTDQTLHDLKKSSAGMGMLEKLKRKGVPYLCANIVISGTNINVVMDVVRHLLDNDIWVNICPVIWGKGDNWETIETADENYRLRPEHKARLEMIAQELIDMKRAGRPIVPTETYLKGIPDFGIGLEWKCYSSEDPSSPPRLIIDADGRLMTCINMRGEVSKRFSIFDLLDEKKYRGFIELWWQDVKTCQGCYWSTMVMAKERQTMLEEIKKGLAMDKGMDQTNP